MTALAPSREALTACRGVTVTYGGGDEIVRALHEVDLEILPEDSLALLGRSGSGKTTLLHVLGGLVIFGIFLLLAAMGRFGPHSAVSVEVAGLYWHFVDIVWIFLFPLLYLV